MDWHLSPLLIFRILHCAFCAICFTYFCGKSIYDYQKLLTRTEIDKVQNAPPEHPAISIFNVNSARRSFIEKWLDKNEDDTNYSKLVKNLNFNSSKEKIRQVGHDFSKMITFCYFTEPCTSPRWTWIPEYGNVYTLREKKPHTSQEQVDDLIVNVFMVDFESEEYLAEMNNQSAKRGVVIKLHDPQDYFSDEIDAKEIRIRPNRFYDIMVTTKVHTSLPSPYWPKCVDYGKERTKKGGKGPTSQTSCFTDCEKQAILEKCGCIPAFIGVNDDDQHICNKGEEAYLNCSRGIQKDTIMNRCYTICPDDCRKITYDVQANHFGLDIPLSGGSKAEIEYLGLDKYDTANITEDTSQVVIRFKERAYSLYNLQPRVTGTNLAISIGGFLGLWLGMGLLQVPLIITKAVKFTEAMKQSNQEKEKAKKCDDNKDAQEEEIPLASHSRRPEEGDEFNSDLKKDVSISMDEPKPACRMRGKSDDVNSEYHTPMKDSTSAASELMQQNNQFKPRDNNEKLPKRISCASLTGIESRNNELNSSHPILNETHTGIEDNTITPIKTAPVNGESPDSKTKKASSVSEVPPENEPKSPDSKGKEPTESNAANSLESKPASKLIDSPKSQIKNTSHPVDHGIAGISDLDPLEDKDSEEKVARLAAGDAHKNDSDVSDPNETTADVSLSSLKFKELEKGEDRLI